MLGGILSICGFTIYAIALRVRGLRMQRETDAQVLAAALRHIKGK
jgi:hypothetical protein